MSKEKPLHVLVPTFINPTLFWIIDTCRILDRGDLEEKLLQISTPAADPIIGERVALKDGDKVKRAQVVEVDASSKRGKYTCWLLDYGIPFTTDCVYELDEGSKSLPPVAVRASLMDVVYLETMMNADDTKLNFFETTKATTGARLKVLEYITDATDIFFRVLQEKNDVSFGDLIVLKDGKQLSITNELIENQILTKNKTMFWEEVDKREPNLGVLPSVIRSVSRNSSNSDRFGVRYDYNSQSYVANGSVKDLVDELEGFGRGQRRRKTDNEPDVVSKGKKVSPNSKGVLNKLLQHKANSSETEAEEAVYCDAPENEITVENARKTPKSSLKTLNVLQKLKGVKIENGNENVNLPSEAAALVEEKNLPDPEEAKSPSEIPRVPQKANTLNMYPGGFQVLHKKKAVKVNFPRPSCSPRPSKNFTPIKKFSTSSSSKSSGSGDNTEKIIHNTDDAPKNYKSSSSSTSGPEEVLRFDNKHKKLLGCPCDSCKFWDVADVKDGQPETFTGAEGKLFPRNAGKPPLLLKIGTEEDMEIKTLPMMPASIALKWKQFKFSALVVHGVAIPSPSLNVVDAPFHEDVHLCLKKFGFEQARKIQTYVWPTIMRNMNVCYVNAPKSGRTMAYLPAIYSFLLEEDKYSGFNAMATGPLAVIVCEGNKAAEEVDERVSIMCGSMRRSFDAVLALLPLTADLTKSLSKKFSILVTTLPTLIALLQLRKLTLKRMCHVIFEDADRLLQKYPKHISSFLGLSQDILQHRTCSLPIQIILSSTRWTNHLQELVKQLVSPPLICIGEYLEAAIYGRVNIKIHFIKSKLKQSALIDILTDEKNYYNKCMVICNREEELEEASALFPNRSIKSVVMKDSLSQNEIKTREEHWNHSPLDNCSVLLCTDGVFNKNLEVTDATLLVHYSLPASWTQFSRRFSCFVDNYTSPFNANKVDELVCKSFIFVDENSQLQFPRLVAFLQRMSVPLPTSFLQHCELVKEQKELEKISKGMRLCDTVKLLGSCDDEKCKMRHVLSKDVDFRSDVGGYVKFEILAVLDVAVYAVRIVEYVINGEIVKNTNNVEGIEQKLDDALSKEAENIEEIALGDWLALFELRTKKYKRCEVAGIAKSGLVSYVLLDDPGKGVAETKDLFKLPDEFKKIPPQATTVYFANMTPLENDRHSSSHSIRILRNIMRNAEEKVGSKIYKGKIRLFLAGDSLWLENIVLTHTVKNTDVTVLYLKEKILKARLAEHKEGALESLFRLCRRADIPVPQYKVETSERKERLQKIEPRHAFLEEDVSYNEVYFRSANSPSEFFVCLKKFYDLVERLEIDLQKEAEKQSSQLDAEVEVNNHYLALDGMGEKYCRVRVTGIENGMADCFFVDHGDQQLVKPENLRKLPEKFISVLPFQAIECRLFGVSPILDCWCGEATDTLYDYCYEPNSDYFRTLYAVVHVKEDARLTGGSKFGISLLDDLTGKVISVGSLMIECGFAGFAEGEQLPDDLPVIVKPAQSDDEDVQEQKQADYIREFVADLEGDGGSGDEWDAQVFDPAKFLSRRNLDLTSHPKERKPANNTAPPNSHPKALPLSDFRTPTVLWHQTDIHVKLSIQIPDVGEYTAKLLRDRVFVFRTEQAGTPYHLTLQLYARVERAIQHAAGGLSVRVVLSKCCKEEWPRLTIQKSVRNVKYDVEMVREVEEGRGRWFLSWGRQDEEVPGEEEEKNVCVGSDFDEGSDSDWMSSD